MLGRARGAWDNGTTLRVHHIHLPAGVSTRASSMHTTPDAMHESHPHAHTKNGRTVAGCATLTVTVPEKQKPRPPHTRSSQGAKAHFSTIGRWWGLFDDAHTPSSRARLLRNPLDTRWKRKPATRPASAKGMNGAEREDEGERWHAACAPPLPDQKSNVAALLSAHIHSLRHVT